MRAFYVFINGGETCLVCGCRTLFYPICKKCFSEKFSVNSILFEGRCKVCGKELLSTDGLCLQCREKSVLVHTDYVLPIFSYRLWNKELMFLWKSEGVRSLSDLFAKIICKVLKKININVIVPVPPRPGKIQKKGWDQIDELSSILKYRYGFKLAPLLERRSDFQQKKLDRIGRLNSIGMSYFLKDKKDISGVLKDFCGKMPRKVCILDDVTTTGATIESCAALLKEIGILEVWAVTLFIVD
ncbi:MAG: hypothetical protein K5829_10460 [Treponema sp.]|nr:hypothetical protein [Treponema sp.]